MGGTCRTYGGIELYIPHFGSEASREESTCNIFAKIVK